MQKLFSDKDRLVSAFGVKLWKFAFVAAYHTMIWCMCNKQGFTKTDMFLIFPCVAFLSHFVVYKYSSCYCWYRVTRSPCCHGVSRTYFKCLFSWFIPCRHARISYGTIFAGTHGAKPYRCCSGELQAGTGIRTKWWFVSLTSSLILTLLFTTETTGFCFDILQEELSVNLLLQRRRLVCYLYGY